MSISSLNFTTTETKPTPTYKATPIQRARNSVLRGIEQQYLLIRIDQGENIPLMKTIKTNDGLEKTKRLNPRKWYWTNNGVIHIALNYCNTPLVLNGKASTIVVGTTIDELKNVLGILVESVRNGEIDSALLAAQKNKKSGRPKKSS